MMRKIRCAIYTRKSSEEGLEQDFNSLDAQREACEAFVASQKAEGWVLVSDLYDDGGLSGGTLVRPALQRLLAEVDAGRIDQIIVYKIDRLTRSLTDFAKIVDRLDAAEASFVSVTQSFNTATSMGRLTLNMLLSFAQFEREVTAERIRDKIAASKKKGLWMGGTVPMGYRADGRSLALDETDAGVIRHLYALYQQHRSVREVAVQADVAGLRTRTQFTDGVRSGGGKLFARRHIHQILSNPIYAGRIRHKDKVYEGQHPALIEPKTWDAVQVLLQSDAARERGSGNTARPSLLASKLFDDTGDRLTPSHTQKSGKRLRYYISRRLVVGQAKDHPDAWRLPAIQLEKGLASELFTYLSDPITLARLAPGVTAADMTRVQSRLQTAIKGLQSDVPLPRLAAILRKAQINRGCISLEIDPNWLTSAADIGAADLNQAALNITCPFQLRRRGVETKIVLGAVPAERDETLIANIRKAQGWYAQIVSGKRFSDLATAEGVERSRIQHMIGLAFLAPDILDQVTAGTQPTSFTSEWAKRNALPADWNDQRRLIAAL
jgi:site-specific DNA recombinase